MLGQEFPVADQIFYYINRARTEITRTRRSSLQLQVRERVLSWEANSPFADQQALNPFSQGWKAAPFILS